MKDIASQIFIPDSLKHAESVLNINIIRNPDPKCSPQDSLVKIWHCIAYLNPRLHPDEIGNPDSGWPAKYISYADEAWKRYEQGELNDGELYPADAQWAGLCDRLDSLTPEEVKRRQALRDAMSGEPIHAHILERMDTKEAFGRISVFYTHRDAEGAYEKWCGEWFETWEDAESYRLAWAKVIYEESTAQSADA
jgi:hypothetical protein